MSLSKDEMEQLKKLLSKASPTQTQQFGINPAWAELKNAFAIPEIPIFHWNSNLGAFKAALKKVEAEGQVSEKEIVKHLQDQGLIKRTATVENYGYVYNETGIFTVNDDDVVSLTEMGKQVAKLCTNDPALRPLEVVIFRGLQQQAAGYSYLSIVGRKPGIYREELTAELEKMYGGNGRYYAGYYTRIYKQLKLVKRTTTHGKARYWLTVPEAWGEARPDIPEEEE